MRRSDDPSMDPVSRSDALDAALDHEQVSPAIQLLFKQGGRNRRLAIIAIVGLIFDVVLSGALGIVSIEARNASRRANKAAKSAATNHALLVTQCETGNQFRANDQATWDKIFTLQAPQPNNLTPEQQKQQAMVAEEFKTFIAAKDAPKDCSKLP